MKSDFLNITAQNIDKEHICCAFSEKKCKEGYELKKEWLKEQFAKGYVFYRLNERAKVFVEYGPAEEAWSPIVAPGYILINCFWVSGRYAGNGYGKQLLKHVIDEAKAKGYKGIVIIAGFKKIPFFPDPKWLIRQGFKESDKLNSGYLLMEYVIDESREKPQFAASLKEEPKGLPLGLVAYYSNRCPFSEYYVNIELTRIAKKHDLPLQIIRINSKEMAQNVPTPATLFSLFKDGVFLTSDMSVCLDGKFEKIVFNSK